MCTESKEAAGWSIVEVRSEKDLDFMARAGAQFYEEARLPGRIIPEVFVRSWTQFIGLKLGTIWMLMRGNEIVGAIGGLVVADPNDGVMVGSEMFWWVMPECRGRGVRLLLRFAEWARERGAERLTMVHLMSSMPEKVGKLYERMGMKPLEVHYVGDLNEMVK